MSDTYTKLFRSITASTIVSEPVATRWLWVTMLSQSDSAGCVWGSIPGLARLANITLEECEAALLCFYSPDPYSRTQTNEGRRIEAIDGGWRLLNHAKYDAIRNEEERAEYKRQWDRKNRPSGYARQSDSPTQVRQQSDTSPTKPDSPTPSAPALTLTTDKQEQRAGTPSAKRGCRLPADWAPSPADIEFATTKHPGVNWTAEADKFRDYWTALPGAKATKADWPATWRNWIRNARPTGPPNGARPSAAANFRGKNYTGTLIDDIPADLRDADAA